MEHVTYLILILSVVSNALLTSRIKARKSYHIWEFLTIGTYSALSVLFYLNMEHIVNWCVMYFFVRFGLYSPIWGKVVTGKWNYLGDTAWTDRALVWLIFEKMNQSENAVLYLNFITFVFSIFMYLNLILT